MRWRTLLLLILVLGCTTRPDASTGFAPPSRVGYTASEFDDAHAGRVSEFGSIAAAPSAARTGRLAAPSGKMPTASTDSAVPTAPREVIYRADLRLVVVSIAEASREVKSIAEAHGGHLQRSTATTIVVRVPAAQFEPAAERIEALGEVVDRSVTATDVSEEVLDLNIRLENARRTRDRLVAHLAASKKIGDTLKIEAELTRVSETIEQIEGRLRLMRSQIAMSTIQVDFSARAPETTARATPLGVPFAWIEALGDGLVAGQVETTPHEAGLFTFPPKITPPSDFIRYFESRDRVEAMSADGLRIAVRRHPNHDQGSLSFWKSLARESLVRARGIAVVDERDLTKSSTLIAGTREIARDKQAYLLVVKRTSRRVYTFEAWGPEAVFELHRGALEESARTLAR